MAGVALRFPLDITWQAWHKRTATVVLRGRRGTYNTGNALGPALSPRRRATLRGRRGAG